VDEEQEGQRRLSWAAATRPLWWLNKRIVDVGGKREVPQEKAWRLEDAAQWELLFGNSCFEGKKHYGDQLLLYARPDMDQFSA
jgi:hypothetical protein